MLVLPVDMKKLFRRKLILVYKIYSYYRDLSKVAKCINVP